MIISARKMSLFLKNARHLLWGSVMLLCLAASPVNAASIKAKTISCGGARTAILDKNHRQKQKKAAQTCESNEKSKGSQLRR